CFFFQDEDGTRDATVNGVQTCALPIWKFWTLIPTRSFPVGANSERAAEGAWGVIAQEDSSSAAKDIVASRIILDPSRSGPARPRSRSADRTRAPPIAISSGPTWRI